MFGIDFPELLLILAVALIVVGPSKIPDIARALGRAYAEFKRAMDELKQTVDQDDTLRGIKEEFRQAQRNIDIKRVFTQPVNPAKPEATPVPQNVPALDPAGESEPGHEDLHEAHEDALPKAIPETPPKPDSPMPPGTSGPTATAGKPESRDSDPKSDPSETKN